MELKDKVIAEIKKIYDPEIPVNIYDLGLIYNVKVDENKKISDIKFEGHGCAISMASASIMTELMKDKDEKDVNELIEDFLKMIKDNPDLKSNLISKDDKTKLMSLSGVKKYPMRVKCATLPWHTLISAMTNKPGEVNTEKED